MLRMACSSNVMATSLRVASSCRRPPSTAGMPGSASGVGAGCCWVATIQIARATSAATTDFRLLRGDHVRWYRASPAARRGFCGNCGSTLFWQADAAPERISIATGLFDGPTGLTTAGHIFCADKGDYYLRVQSDHPVDYTVGVRRLADEFRDYLTALQIDLKSAEKSDKAPSKK